MGGVNELNASFFLSHFLAYTNHAMSQKRGRKKVMEENEELVVGALERTGLLNLARKSDNRILVPKVEGEKSPAHIEFL